MYNGNRILAIVPARSGSKGIADKNMSKLNDISLIGWAGKCLAELEWLDGKMLSTDSEVYATEGKKFGLDVPFLRPAELSNDTASAVDTMIHAVNVAEEYYNVEFDIIVLIEPTSPLRKSVDILKSIEMMLASGADSAVTVSRLNPKYHPSKVLTVDKDKLEFYDEKGKSVIGRQSLSVLYWRNGACYAIKKKVLFNQKRIINDNTIPVIIERTLINIDEPFELLLADFYSKNNQEEL